MKVETYICDFCGVTTGTGDNKGEKVESLIIKSEIDGKEVCICDSCVDLCAEIVEDRVIGKEKKEFSYNTYTTLIGDYTAYAGHYKVSAIKAIRDSHVAIGKVQTWQGGKVIKTESIIP
jgi:ATP-dependent protease Clp ATPase subunit